MTRACLHRIILNQSVVVLFSKLTVCILYLVDTVYCTNSSLPGVSDSDCTHISHISIVSDNSITLDYLIQSYDLIPPLPPPLICLHYCELTFESF